MKPFKCPRCKEESYSMLEVTRNIVEYTDIDIDEEDDSDMAISGYGDTEISYEESETVYRCNNCNYELPYVIGLSALARYLRSRK